MARGVPVITRDRHADRLKDQREGKYEPPHSNTPLDHIVHDKATLDKLQRDNDQYDAGYKNARNQK
jgi:hypothetical protein